MPAATGQDWTDHAWWVQFAKALRERRAVAGFAAFDANAFDGD